MTTSEVSSISAILLWFGKNSWHNTLADDICRHVVDVAIGMRVAGFVGHVFVMQLGARTSSKGRAAFDAINESFAAACTLVEDMSYISPIEGDDSLFADAYHLSPDGYAECYGRISSLISA